MTSRISQYSSWVRLYLQCNANQVNTWNKDSWSSRILCLCSSFWSRATDINCHVLCNTRETSITRQSWNKVQLPTVLSTRSEDSALAQNGHTYPSPPKIHLLKWWCSPHWYWDTECLYHNMLYHELQIGTWTHKINTGENTQTFHSSCNGNYKLAHRH